MWEIGRRNLVFRMGELGVEEIRGEVDGEVLLTGNGEAFIPV